MIGRTALALLVALFASGCNDGDLTIAPEEEEPVVTGEPTPEPGETPDPNEPDPTPPPTPLPTPVPCAFYGIGQNGDLWVIDPTVPDATLVGNSYKQGTTDLAILPDGRMVTITEGAAFLLDPTTAQAYSFEPTRWVEGQNSLDGLADGRLLVGGGGSLIAIDPVTHQAEPFAGLPFGLPAYSGDVSADGGTIGWGSARDNWEETDYLVRVDFANGTIAQIGAFGSRLVFGLDVGCDGNLYGIFSGDPETSLPPRLLRVNPATAATTVVGDLEGPVKLWGAAGPVL